MSELTNSKMSPLDMLKWFFVVACAAAIVVGNTKYAEVGALYRVLAIFGGVLVAAAVASSTMHGAAVIQLIKDARIEVRKVVWPTGQETLQTTLVVVVMILIMALLLWLLDTGLGWSVKTVIG